MLVGLKIVVVVLVVVVIIIIVMRVHCGDRSCFRCRRDFTRGVPIVVPDTVTKVSTTC